MLFKLPATICSAVLAACLLASSARADSITVGFDRVTSNASQNVENQFSVVVSSYDADEIQFVFYNGGGSGIAATICDIYFGPKVGTSPSTVAGLLGTTVTFDSANSSSGISFADGATPGNAPGGSWTAGAAADSNSPVCPNGIALNEHGTFRLTLLSGKTWDDVADALLAGELLMALHVQAIGTGGKSDTFESVTPVPEPGTLLLLGGALGAGALARRRRQRAAASRA